LNEKTRTTISISVAVLGRVRAFQPVVEAVVEEAFDIESLLDLVLERGLSCMLRDVIGSVDPDILVSSMDQMSVENPEFVYGFVADRIRSGADVRKEEAKRRLGFIKDQA